MNVQPGATYEAVVDWGVTGDTLGLRVIDNAGNTTVARLTTSITEYPAGSGIYARTGNVAPGIEGQYTIVWDNGTDYATEDLLVTGTAAAVVITATGDLYVTRDELKATLNIGSVYADDDIDIACSAASRACDGYKNIGPGLFAPVTQTRYYSPECGDRFVTIDPLNTLTSVKVDVDGNGTYETTWTSGTDFILEPENAATDGFPYTELRILPQSGQRFSGYLKSVQVIGSFGWAEVPAAVAQASRILAGRLLKRSRETPYGIVVVSGDAVAAARLGRIDPDVAFLLDNLPGSVPLLAI